MIFIFAYINSQTILLGVYAQNNISKTWRHMEFQAEYNLF